MSILSVFGELKIKLTDQFKRSILYAIGVYFFSWLILQIFFWIFAGLIWVISLIMGGKPFSLTPLLYGFTLFPYFPYWLRIILLVYIAVAVINVPIAIFLIMFLDLNTSVSEYSESRNNIQIFCVECRNPIKVPGDWLNGTTDIRCWKCHSLMSLTLENGRFKALILK